MYDWLEEIVTGTQTWVTDVVSSVFTAETAYDALAGAVIGGTTAALTGHDVVDGALYGGGAGAVVGAYSNYQDAKTGGYRPSDDVSIEGVSDYNSGLIPSATADTDFSLGSSVDFNVDPASDIALNGVNVQNVASSQSKYSLNYSPSGNPVNKITSGWSNMGEKMRSDIVSGAIKGGAGYLIARSQDKARTKDQKNLQKMKDQSAEDQYNRTKKKVGDVRGLVPTFSINKEKFASSRLNTAR